MLKDVIIFIFGVIQGMIILDWLHSKQDLHLAVKSKKVK